MKTMKPKDDQSNEAQNNSTESGLALAAETDGVSGLVAGRELDALIAERIMGWVRGRRYGNGNGDWIIDGKEGRRTWETTPRYSSDSAAAMQVFQRLREMDFIVVLETAINGQWCVTVENWEEAADTIPLAICRAALQATATVLHGAPADQE